MRENEEFDAVSDLFADFNNVLSEIHDIVLKITHNKLNESLGFYELLEDENSLQKRLNFLKSKLQNLKKDITNHLNVLSRLIGDHIQRLRPLQVKMLNRSLVDIMIQNIQSEIEFESIQKLSDDLLTAEEVGLDDIDESKVRLNVAITKLNKRSEYKMMLVSEARTEAWYEMKDMERQHRER